MNPFNNRWLALFVVVGFLLVVAELVGTGEHGGVLSQAARSYSAGEGAEGEGAEAPPEVIRERPTVIDDVPEDVPEEDMPQIVTEDDTDDSADFLAGDPSETEMADASADDVIDDGSSDE